MRWAVDRALIRELTARYNHCFDSGDATGFASTFLHEGEVVIEGGPTISGHDALVAMCTQTPYGTMHVTTDAEVTLDGDRATQRCTILVVGRPGAGRPGDEPRRHPSLQRSGIYDDELVRTPEGWRFVRRRVTLDSPTRPESR